MSKKRSVHSQKGVVKVNVRKMGSSLKKKSDITFSFTETKDRKAKVAVDLDSVDFDATIITVVNIEKAGFWFKEGHNEETVG